MSARILQVLLLLLIAAGAGLGAISSLVCVRKPSVASGGLTKESAAAIRRFETEFPAVPNPAQGTLPPARGRPVVHQLPMLPRLELSFANTSPRASESGSSPILA